MAAIRKLKLSLVNGKNFFWLRFIDREYVLDSGESTGIEEMFLLRTKSWGFWCYSTYEKFLKEF